MNYKYFVQFTAGRGPVECAAACSNIVNKFIKEISELDIIENVIDIEEDLEYGYRSIILQLEDINEDDFEILRNKWEGTIKFISLKNHFRPHHKRKNWFVGCNFFKIDSTEIKFDMKDIKVDTMRASGPGGQNVNKVETGVRLIHIPTGIIVKCTISRDQRQNLKLAKELMQAKINSLQEAKEKNIKNQFWMNHDNLERGGEIMTIKGNL